MYHRYVLDGIKVTNKSYFFQAEFLIKAIKKGYIYAEVGFGMRERLGGKAKIRLKSFTRVDFWVF